MPCLRLCTFHHEPFLFAGETCPYCRLRHELEEARGLIATLQGALRDLQRPHTPDPQKETE